MSDLGEAILKLRAAALCRLANLKGFNANPATIETLVRSRNDTDVMRELEHRQYRMNWFWSLFRR